MKYGIVTSGSLIGLQKKVAEALRKGWELQGGVSSTSYEEGSMAVLAVNLVFTQALVKHPRKPYRARSKRWT